MSWLAALEAFRNWVAAGPEGPRNAMKVASKRLSILAHPRGRLKTDFLVMGSLTFG
jgi:hypothetical protein